MANINGVTLSAGSGPTVKYTTTCGASGGTNNAVTGYEIQYSDSANNTDCEAGQIDYIVTKSISRFARNTLDCLKYIRQLKEKSIPVYFEKENINTMDFKGEVLLTIIASLAQQES